MPILYIMCGPSGSGKSTWAKNIDNIKETAYEYVSRDEIRFSLLKEGEDYFAHEKEVFKRFVQTIANCLKITGTVVADATHLNMFSRCKLIQALDMYTTDYNIIYVVFNTDVETCVERNKAREGRRNVPENIIRNMCRDFRAPTEDEDERIIDIIEVGE